MRVVRSEDLTPRPGDKKALKRWLSGYIEFIEELQRSPESPARINALSVIYYHLRSQGIDVDMVELFVAERMGIAGTIFWETPAKKEWDVWRKLLGTTLPSGQNSPNG